MDEGICPKCKSEETFYVNHFNEFGFSVRECEECSCVYRVYFRTVVSKIEVINKNF